MESITIIFSIIIVIISVMFHELAHGTMADYLGDKTARFAGRLTLNPLKHLEWIGSFLVPLLCVISGSGFIIGWAKPVPFNPHNLKYKRWGPALVAFAGPLINIIIAVITSLIIKVAAATASPAFIQMMVTVLAINIALAVFNLMPLPPLDGHHILGAIFPRYQRWSAQFMDKFGIVGLVIVIFLLSSFISPVIGFFINLLL